MADMRTNCAGTSTTAVTTIYGIDRADTGNLFDDVQLSRSVPTNSHREEVVAQPAVSRETEERNVRELVIRLPQMGDTNPSSTRPNTRVNIAGAMKLEARPHQLHPYRKPVCETQSKPIPTAVCEVFQFTNGSINNLKPVTHHFASLPNRQRPTKSADKNINSSELHPINLNMNPNRNTLVSLSAKRRLNFLSMMKKYYNYQSMPKLPDIATEYTSLTANRRQAKSSPAKIEANKTQTSESSNRDMSSDGYGDMDCELRSRLATRGESRGSIESLEELGDVEFTAEDNNAERVESPWPTATGNQTQHGAMVVRQLTANTDKHSRATMNIYHKTRRLSKPQKDETNRSLTNALEYNISTSYHSKLPSIDTKQTASQENKMFEESYYDQFSHRKLKKIVTPNERRRSKSEATKLTSKQYDKREAMQYIKVKIGKDVEANDNIEYTSEGREDEKAMAID